MIDSPSTYVCFDQVVKTPSRRATSSLLIMRQHAREKIDTLISIVRTHATSHQTRKS